MIKIAVFASGNGGNFEALVASSLKGEIPAEIDVCICDCPGARVSERASRLGVDYIEFNPKTFQSKRDYEKMIADELDRRGIELVCLAGYMRIVGDELLKRYEGRILNIHPSLLPSFKGANGIRDAFDYGVKIYGVTVHYVDNTLDGGKILDQEAFRYEGGDKEELEKKIHEVEHMLYPRAVNEFITNSQNRNSL